MSEREQCWVINNEVVDPPPQLAISKDELTRRHHDFIHDLDTKGALVGAGPFLDDSGARFGTGMIIFRAATRREAEAIANSEPYIAHGVRRINRPGQPIMRHLRNFRRLRLRQTRVGGDHADDRVLTRLGTRRSASSQQFSRISEATAVG